MENSHCSQWPSLISSSKPAFCYMKYCSFRKGKEGKARKGKDHLWEVSSARTDTSHARHFLWIQVWRLPEFFQKSLKKPGQELVPSSLLALRTGCGPSHEWGMYISRSRRATDWQHCHQWKVSGATGPHGPETAAERNCSQRQHTLILIMRHH